MAISVFPFHSNDDADLLCLYSTFHTFYIPKYTVEWPASIVVSKFK